MDGNITTTAKTETFATEDDIFDLYDEYCHTEMERRDFFTRTSKPRSNRPAKSSKSTPIPAPSTASTTIRPPRYNKEAAQLAWDRTMAFFKANLA